MDRSVRAQRTGAEPYSLRLRPRRNAAGEAIDVAAAPVVAAPMVSVNAIAANSNPPQARRIYRLIPQQATANRQPAAAQPFAADQQQGPPALDVLDADFEPIAEPRLVISPHNWLNYISAMDEAEYADFMGDFYDSDQEEEEDEVAQVATFPPMPSKEEIKRARAEIARKLPAAIADTTKACAICLEEKMLQRTIILPCVHQICHRCLFEWGKAKTSCPICRQEIYKVLYNFRSDAQYDTCHDDMRVPFDAISPYERPYRYIRMLLMQTMTSLAEKYPERGFPTDRLDYATFTSAFPLRMTEDEQLHQYYRCYLLRHDYTPSQMPARSMKKEDPEVVTARLLAFITAELNSLEAAFVVFSGIEKSIDFRVQMTAALTQSPDLFGAEFKSRFRSAIDTNTRLRSQSFGYDIIDNLLKELWYFSLSNFERHKDYVCQTTFYAKHVGPMAPQAALQKPPSSDQTARTAKTETISSS